uniref:Ionotropic glutamate receptor C-terminal domain-containing protein n=1 Tax=Anopheles culicifacies TaxID=139723 RepID=A0A182M3K1_9DIPT
MKLTSKQTLSVCLQNVLLLYACLANSAQSTLLDMVDAIAAFDNETDISGTNVCIFTTANSSLPAISPQLLPTLMAKYPTVFLHTFDYVTVEHALLASLVLLDLTAYHYEFPFKYIQQRLNQHPCYKKTAKFIILLGGSSFQRKQTAIHYLEKFSILNYILVPVSNSSSSLTLYTKNQFTNHEYYFRSDDRPVQKFFPDKLRNINGYKFKLQGITMYPYMSFNDEGIVYGLVPHFVKLVIQKRCNGTTYFTEDPSIRRAMDAVFNIPDDRFSYPQTFYFREETGIYFICPIRTVRDFLRHLLKPFSVGIWIILAGLFAFCRIVQILFPTLYQYDLIALTFFGGGGIEYHQPFAFRIITLTLAILMFFLSEAYNTKIISLMTIAKYYEQPQTIDELHNSDFRILSTRAGSKFLGPISDNFLSYPATLRAERRLGHRVLEHYCMMMHLGNAWLAVSQQWEDFLGSLYIVEEPLMIDKNLIQFAQHTPFFDLFETMFGWLNDSGIWAHMLQKSKEMLYRGPKMFEATQFQEIIFYFNDLYCVWILVVAGWMISTACFVVEIVTDACRQRKLRRAARFLNVTQKYPFHYASITEDCNLSPTIDKLVQLQRHRFLSNANAEICIVTTNASTLSATHPNVMGLLISQHPTMFATERNMQVLLRRRYANVVLLDATGWDQFFDDQGIVNYAIVPMPSNNFDRVDNTTIYTENRFSKMETYVQLSDLDQMHRLFPNKFTNLHRFHIRIGVIPDFPYIIIYPDRTVGGLISHFFNDVGRKVLNLSYTFIHQLSSRDDLEANFNLASFREHFQHEIDLREMGGVCLLCPVNTGRDFLTHLLKPFSLAIWMVLAGVFMVCVILRRRYPHIFRYDLILVTFFGGGGIEYNQTFAFRIVLLTLAMLLFFFSEAYNTKIISLMSLAKFYERPETMAEFRKSDYRIVRAKTHTALLGDLRSKMISVRETNQLRRKLGIRMYRYYCTTLACGDAWLIALSEFQVESFPMYVLREKAIETTQRMQFATNSPIVGTIKRYFGLYCETGLWARQKGRHNNILSVLSEMKNTFSEVIFYYDDLLCVWILFAAEKPIKSNQKLKYANVVLLDVTGWDQFAAEKPIKSNQKLKYANVVLLDVTGWDQFKQQFRDNPCHFIDARFIVLVTRLCYLKDRSTVVQFFDDQGIVNYAIIPMPLRDSDPTSDISIYTENRFSKEKIFVEMRNLDNLHRLFPNKLANLFGYRIRVGVRKNDFPYIMIYSMDRDETSEDEGGNVILGTVKIFLWDVGIRVLNFSYSFFEQASDQYDGDVYFDISLERAHFQHKFAFREMGGICLLCPARTGRCFFPYLLQPFSLGFHHQPETMAEFMASDYKFLRYENEHTKHLDGKLRSKQLDAEEFQLMKAKYGLQIHHHFCSLQICGDAMLQSSMLLHTESHPVFMVREKINPTLHTLQFAENSPLFRTVQYYFGLYNERGLWRYTMNKHYNMLKKPPTPTNTLAGVVFYFEDLMSVWLLLVAGWMFSIVVFVCEVYFQ